jgi:hypothetical protein
MAIAARPRVPAAFRRSGGWPAPLPLIVLVALGLALRVATMALYWPGLMVSVDTPRFARVSPAELFGDFWMPAGYPAFLKVLHVVSDSVWLSIAVQHLLGVGVGVALYLACRRLGTSRAVACIPAAVALLSGDHLYLEHILMADSFLIAVAAAGLLAAVRGLVPRVDARWLALAGGLLSTAALVRSPALGCLAVLLGCTLVWAPGGLRSRVRAVSAVLAGAGIVAALYLGAFVVSNGRYLGVTDMGGWNLYARVAPFADCSQFTPPAGTRQLCETTPPAQRAGPFGYEWDANSIARRSIPLEPDTARPLRAYARAAVLAQPTDYLGAVLTDLGRYVEPTLGPERPFSGQPRDIVNFAWRDATVEEQVRSAMAQRYDGTVVAAPGADLLGAYQNLVRLDRLALLAALALTLAGMLRARGPLRLGVYLFGLSALALYVIPVLTLSYDFRYGIPPETFIAVSATLGAVALLCPRVQNTAS